MRELTMGNERLPDVQQQWLAQSGTPSPMPLDLIREKARLFEARQKLWKNVGAIVGIVLIIANAVQAVWPGRNPVERTGDTLSVVAFFFIGYQYWKHARFASPGRLGTTDCREFYRAQLIQERNLAGQSKRYLLPFVPGVGLSLLGGVLKAPSPLRSIELAAFGIALFAAAAWWNEFTARRLQRELDELDLP